jgi:acetolactate synthase I/II/III large subunit
MTTVADAIGRALAGDGIRHAFGVVGNGNLLAVGGLIAGGARYSSARHEGGAMAMADVYYRVTGEVAVCTTTCGSGFSNTATALLEAARYRSGVLVLCGDAPTGGLRPIDFDQSALAASLGVRAVRVCGPDTALAQTAEALRLARSLCRPVALFVPHDLLTAQAPEPEAAPPRGERDTRGAVPSPRRALDPAGLDAALDLLAGARNPLLLGGLGAWRSGAGKAVADLADGLGALLATTVMADGLFGPSPWSVGICGGFSAPASAELIGEADVVLAFGASLNHWTLHSGRMLHPDAAVVRVDLAGTPAPARVDLDLTADATEAATALLDGVNARGLRPADWRVRAAPQLARARWREEAFADAGTADRLDPRTLSRAIADRLPPERTVVTDGGHFTAWPFMYWPAPDPSGLAFTGAASQTIGMGFAGAAGAALGRPERTTVVALGDGGALMGLPELETLIRVGRSTLIVVYDDASYGMEVHVYRPLGADLSGALFSDTDFAGVARALGARAATVRRVEDLAELDAWCAQGRPGTLLLDCKIVADVIAPFVSGIAGTVVGARTEPSAAVGAGR